MGYYMENGVAYGAGITPITIEGTLVAGATSIAFTNNAILEGERYNVYAWDKPTVKPTNMVVSGHTLTLTYPAQSTDTRIKVVINENVNTLMFDDTNKADKSDLTSIFATGSTNTTGSAISTGTYFYLDNVLVRAKTNIATNATFTLNTNYEVVSAGALNAGKVYSTNEQRIGTWVDGKALYEKCVYIDNFPNGGSRDYSAGIGANIVDRVIEMFVMRKDYTNSQIIFPDVWSTSCSARLYYTPSTDKVTISMSGDGNGSTGYVIMRYTKN